MTPRICINSWPNNEPKTVEELTRDYVDSFKGSRTYYSHKCARSVAFHCGYKAAAKDASAEIKRLEANLKLEASRNRLLFSELLKCKNNEKNMAK